MGWIREGWLISETPLSRYHNNHRSSLPFLQLQPPFDSHYEYPHHHHLHSDQTLVTHSLRLALIVRTVSSPDWVIKEARVREAYWLLNPLHSANSFVVVPWTSTRSPLWKQGLAINLIGVVFPWNSAPAWCWLWRFCRRSCHTTMAPQNLSPRSLWCHELFNIKVLI